MEKDILKEQAKSSILNDTTNEISKVAVSAIGISAGLIGVWAVACILSGMLNSGGPVNLINNLFKAIVG